MYFLHLVIFFKSKKQSDIFQIKNSGWTKLKAKTFMIQNKLFNILNNDKQQENFLSNFNIKPDFRKNETLRRIESFKIFKTNSGNRIIYYYIF